MVLIGICATTYEGVIASSNNNLPWNISQELRLFKHLTKNSTVIMGRKTYEVIGKPLPNRENWVLSKNIKYVEEGVTFFHSHNEILNLVRKSNNFFFVIGGKEIFYLFKDHLDYWLISWIIKNYKGSIKIDWEQHMLKQFRIIDQEFYKEFNNCVYRRKKYEKKTT